MPVPAPTWPVAAGSLAAGFAVAQVTGVRPLGGLVLAAGAAWCARRWLAREGPRVTAGLLGVYLAAFVGAHLIADPVGAWPAVVLVAALCGSCTWVVTDRGRGAPAAGTRTL